MSYKVVPASVYFTDHEGGTVFIRTAAIVSIALERQNDQAFIYAASEQFHTAYGVGLYLAQLLFPEAYADYEDTRPLPEGFEPPTDEEDTAPAGLKAVGSE